MSNIMAINSGVLLARERAFPITGAARSAAAMLIENPDRTLSHDLVKNTSTVLKL